MIKRILDKLIGQTRDLLQLLEELAEEIEPQQHAEKESPQCINCDAMLVGSRITSIREGLCNSCWDNCHPMHPQLVESVRLHNI